MMTMTVTAPRIFFTMAMNVNATATASGFLSVIMVTAPAQIQCRVLRLGFAFNERMAFVSYDQYDYFLDTTVLWFAEEPFDHVWNVGDPVLQSVAGKMYLREVGVQYQGVGGVGYYLYPGQLDAPVDTFIIIQMLQRGGSLGSYRQDGWRCSTTTFRGSFIHRDTLRGEVLIQNCQHSDTTQVLPANLRNRARGNFPVTYVRVPAI